MVRPRSLYVGLRVPWVPHGQDVHLSSRRQLRLRGGGGGEGQAKGKGECGREGGEVRGRVGEGTCITLWLTSLSHRVSSVLFQTLCKHMSCSVFDVGALEFIAHGWIFRWVSVFRPIYIPVMNLYFVLPRPQAVRFLAFWWTAWGLGAGLDPRSRREGPRQLEEEHGALE